MSSEINLGRLKLEEHKNERDALIKILDTLPRELATSLPPKDRGMFDRLNHGWHHETTKDRTSLDLSTSDVGLSYEPANRPKQIPSPEQTRNYTSEGGWAQVLRHCVFPPTTVGLANALECHSTSQVPEDWKRCLIHAIQWQNTDHVRLAVDAGPPAGLARVIDFVRELQDFAGQWNARIAELGPAHGTKYNHFLIFGPKIKRIELLLVHPTASTTVSPVYDIQTESVAAILSGLAALCHANLRQQGDGLRVKCLMSNTDLLPSMRRDATWIRCLVRAEISRHGHLELVHPPGKVSIPWVNLMITKALHVTQHWLSIGLQAQGVQNDSLDATPVADLLAAMISDRRLPFGSTQPAFLPVLRLCDIHIWPDSVDWDVTRAARYVQGIPKIGRVIWSRAFVYRGRPWPVALAQAFIARVRDIDPAAPMPRIAHEVIVRHRDTNAQGQAGWSVVEVAGLPTVDLAHGAPIHPDHPDEHRRHLRVLTGQLAATLHAKNELHPAPAHHTHAELIASMRAGLASHANAVDAWDHRQLIAHH